MSYIDAVGIEDLSLSISDYGMLGDWVSEDAFVSNCLFAYNIN